MSYPQGYPQGYPQMTFAKKNIYRYNTRSDLGSTEGEGVRRVLLYIYKKMEKEKIKKENEIVKDRLGLSLELTFVVLAIFILGFQTGVTDQIDFRQKTAKEKSDLLKMIPDFLAENPNNKKFVSDYCKS